MSKLKAQAFFKEERRFNGIVEKPRELRGMRLTELQVQAVVNSNKDIDDIIEFLNASRDCFIVGASK